MGREVRHVPADWKHPKSEQGPDEYQPLYDNPYEGVAADWMWQCTLWSQKVHPDQENHKGKDLLPKYFWDWHGGPPDSTYYRPDWPEESRTHLQMYETTTEGTPISPVMETPEELAHWLDDNNASAFGSETATYEQWLYVCKNGYAPSAIAVGGVLKSGVAGMSDID